MATFTLTPLDFSRLQKVIAKRLRRNEGLFTGIFLVRVAVWMCVGLAAAAYGRLIGANPEIAHELKVVGALVLIALVLIVCLPYASNRMLRKHLLSPQGAFLSQQTVELREESLVITTTTARSEVAWARILAKDEDAANLYLFIDTMQAIIIPLATAVNLNPVLQQRLERVPP